MRRLATILFLTLIVPCIAFAQSNGKITGKIIDEKNKEPLEGATISAMNEKTGLFIKHAVSNKKGEFNISGLPNITDVVIIVSFTGYRDTSAVFDLTTVKKTVNTGQWKMKEGSGDELEEVVVTARKPPFIVKKDTIEFNATAFKSLPNDMVQDLLRKMPGMVVDEQGNVTLNGRKVNKIKVDGRDFFEGNMKTALENLPGLIIDKVQVYETRERGQEFNSVIEPIGKDLTLNLKLKKEHRKGMFGTVGAGAGTEDRYNGNAFINFFNEGKRMSFMGNTGNTSRGMGRGGMAFGNGGVEMGGMGSGIINNNTGLGFNFNNEMGKKGKLDANYMFDNGDQSSITTIDRTNILPDSTFLYKSVANSKSDNQNHNLTLNYETQIDSLQELRINPTISFRNNLQESIVNSGSTDNAGKPINSQDNKSISRDKPLSINNTLNYNRSSADRKTNFSVNWNFMYNTGKGNQSNRNENIFYRDGMPLTESLNQQGDIYNNGVSNNLSLNVYRHLSKKIVGIVHYNFSQNNNRHDKDVFNYNNASGKHDILDSIYSIHNRNTGITHEPSASIGYKGEKFSAELGAGLRFTDQENKVVWKDSVVKVEQRNFTPRLNLSYRLSKNFQITTNYSVESNQPTPEQLAPVQDNTNPLYIKVGNPLLKTAIAHQFHTQLRFFSSDFKWNVGLMGGGSVISNQIVSDTYYDTSARQISTYRNVNGTQNFNLHLNLSSVLRFNELTLSLGVSPGLSYNNSIGFVNKEKNNTKGLMFSPNAMVSLNYGYKLSVTVNASVNSNNTRYSLAGIDDVEYNTKSLMLFARWSPVKRLVLASSVFHNYNSQLPEEFQRSRTIVNSSLQYSFLKSERLTAGISVNDIFNQNIAVTRSVTATAIENTQVNALRRYGLVTLSYRLSNFGAGMGAMRMQRYH